jgi:rfaE bifunctional protein kinase chain/domain
MTIYSSNDSDPISEIINKIRPQGKVVFVSGNFNITHPGHVRLLNFAAECGDLLVVGVTPDSAVDVYLSQELRAESLSSHAGVDLVIRLEESATNFINKLKPDIVVKGKEHEFNHNAEKEILDSYGGKLLFSSGDSFFSSLELLQKELRSSNSPSLEIPADYLKRHSIEKGKLINYVDTFNKIRVLVIGDLILDEYITCDPIGMSQEDPTIVVAPIHSDTFIGGAGIVAIHAAGLGANVTFFSIAGADEKKEFVVEGLKKKGVSPFIYSDESRPTTLKQRYRANGKTLLRVSHLRQHEIDEKLSSLLYDEITSKLSEIDLLIFSDFNYGCLPTSLVNSLINFCISKGIPMVADSQSSSQIGDISRFRGMMLITPTEHEARIALTDKVSGLAVLGEKLVKKAESQNCLITLGAEGLFIQNNSSMEEGMTVDQLPALNDSPKDVSGAGDCLLVSTALGLVSGATIWEASYIGSIAAACQVSRVGNIQIKASEIIESLLA